MCGIPRAEGVDSRVLADWSPNDDAREKRDEKSAPVCDRSIQQADWSYISFLWWIQSSWLS